MEECGGSKIATRETSGATSSPPPTLHSSCTRTCQVSLLLSSSLGVPACEMTSVSCFFSFFLSSFMRGFLFLVLCRFFHSFCLFYVAFFVSLSPLFSPLAVLCRRAAGLDSLVLTLSISTLFSHPFLVLLFSSLHDMSMRSCVSVFLSPARRLPLSLVCFFLCIFHTTAVSSRRPRLFAKTCKVGSPASLSSALPPRLTPRCLSVCPFPPSFPFVASLSR